ncbi:MAG: sulfatase-like hydrolase/transferase, partial [Candidatus Latescibacteria bacterium]|nr:sulfatase-like hydrolase/transferase [Candidatus Latescibacterota bacterium]
SFLSGLYPSSVHGNINGNAHCNLPENARLVTARFRDAGYDCGLSGKLHIASAWEGEEERVDDGYRRFWYSHSGTQDHNNANQYWTWLKSIGHFDEALDTSNIKPEVRSGVKYHKDIPPELHQTSWCCDRAIEFMNEPRNSPWLMSVNIFDPHPGYDAPESLAADIDPDTMPKPPFKNSDMEIQEKLSSHIFQKKPQVPDEAQQKRTANYYAMIELIDQNVGRMLDELERTGQRDNTVIVFMSDHGQLLGDHGLENKGCRFYEGLIRVPLIISWPGHFKAGLQSDALVELTDIAPTLCDLAGVNPGWTHGKSLLSILTGETDPSHHKDFVRSEYYNVLDMNWNRGKPAPPPSYATMYRTKQHKLVVYHGNDYGELYDLENDPDEHENLWENSDAQNLKIQMIKDSFNASTLIHDPGSTRIGRF